MPCAAAGRDNTETPLREPFTHLWSYWAEGIVNKPEIQSLLPNPWSPSLRPSRWDTRSGLPGPGQAACRACNALPPFTKSLQVHTLPRWDLPTGSPKFPGKHTPHIDLHHSQHPDWLLTARLAPTDLLPGQMPCVV